MTIPIESIKQLREETGAGILDCRKALEQASGDYPQARAYLYEKGLQAAVKRADRETLQGVVEIYSHGSGRVGVMVEINCETDFAARSETFRTFAHEIALQIAAAVPQYLRDEDIPAAVLEEEAQKVAGKARLDGKPEAIIPRIVEGSLNKFKDEVVLLRQPYIREPKTSVQQVLNQAIATTGENIVIRRFARWEVGETTS